MNRAVRLTLAAIAGLAVGAAVMLVVQDGRHPARSGATDLASGATVTPSAGGTTSTSSAVPTSPGSERAPAGSRLEPVLAWTPGRLPDGFASSVEALPTVAAVTVVRGDPVTMVRASDAAGRTVGPVPLPGMVIPLDALALDPATYPAFVAPAYRRAFRTLGPGEAVLGETSARLRGLLPGGHVDLSGGARLTITAIVDDPGVAAAEIVVSQATGASIGVTTDRYLLATPARDVTRTATAIRAIADPAVPLRVRQTGETPYLRSSDAVLPQARIKDVFGEFAYAEPVVGRDLHQDPAWVAAHIVTAEIPVLGPVTCNRGLIQALTGAMRELAERNLAGLISSYDGCYNPRLIAEGGTISRHAWGAAIDLNFSGNRTGTSSIQDPRLVEVMERWGFASGDGWLVPDPGHFEYIGPPR